jgi:hypothetical protein
MSNEADFRAILALQQEIDEKVDEYITRVKAILKEERDEKKNPRVIAELDGEIYQLVKDHETGYATDLCRKHGGFYHYYRLVRLGRPVK